jgi:hypothetical protein
MDVTSSPMDKRCPHTTWRHSTRLAIMAALMTVLSAAAIARQRDGRTGVIEWPNREFPTIQSAIDALPDGGTLRFTQAVVRVDEPLFVRGKRIVIEGNGCDEQSPRPKTGTHLVGPRAERLAEFDAVRGLINFEPGEPGQPASGATIRNLKVSGFDAGIRATGDASRTAGAVVVEKVCITNTGRGIAWTAAASLSLKNVLIRDVAWNGVSITPATTLAGAFVHFGGVTILNAAGACVYYQSVQAVIVGSLFNNCGTSGTIVSLNANVLVADTSIAGSRGPGIAISGGSTFINDTFINQATGFGILLHNVVHGDVEDVHIKDTTAFTAGAQAGLFGDGVTVVGGTASGMVWVTASLIENAAHSGVANYGAFVSVGDLKIQCALFDLEGEVLDGTPFTYTDLGGLKCGCSTAAGACEAVSDSNSQVPGPIQPIP